MVDRRSGGQAGALARTHGWQQAPAAGLCRCARTVGGTSRPGQRLLPQSVGRGLQPPGQRRPFWQGRRRMVKPETPAKKHYVMCDTWRKEQNEQKLDFSVSELWARVRPPTF